METREDYFRRKHTCRFCQYRSVTIVQMHERTCDLNPNRDAYIAKRYGVRHLTGAMIVKLTQADKVDQTVPQRTLAKLRSARKSVTDESSVKDKSVLAYYPLDSTFTTFAAITSEPLPVLTGDDIISFFSTV